MTNAEKVRARVRLEAGEGQRAVARIFGFVTEKALEKQFTPEEWQDILRIRAQNRAQAPKGDGSGSWRDQRNKRLQYNLQTKASTRTWDE